MLSEFINSLDLVDWSNPVNKSHPLNRDLVAWWLAVPNRAGWRSVIWRDLIGRYNGTLTNMDPATDWVRASHPGGYSALDFNGTANEVITGTVAHGIGTGEFTWTFWGMRREADGTAFKGTITNGDFAPGCYMKLGSASFANEWGAFWGAGLRSGTQLAVNEWNFLCMRRVGTTLSFWRNGVQEPTTHTISTSMANALMRIGTTSTIGANYSSQQLNDIRVYKRGLSDDQIRNLYWHSRRGNASLLTRVPLPFHQMEQAAGVGNRRRRAIICGASA